MAAARARHAKRTLAEEMIFISLLVRESVREPPFQKRS
jgi:hypothetical protein